MKGISINGMKLHEVMMPLVAHLNCNSVMSQCYPKGRIDFEVNDSVIELSIPSKLALEMYRVGILPQDAKEVFSIAISGKLIGYFKVSSFLYPNSTTDNDIVFIKFNQQEKC